MRLCLVIIIVIYDYLNLMIFYFFENLIFT